MKITVTDVKQPRVLMQNTNLRPCYYSAEVLETCTGGCGNVQKGPSADSRESARASEEETFEQSLKG